MRPSPHSWTAEQVEALGHLWRAGLSAREIGRQLRASPNAVTSKAHRLGLPKREDPVRGKA